MKKQRWVPPFLGFFLILSLLESLVRLELISPALFPAPTRIFSTLLELKADFFTAFCETFWGVVKGFLLSIFLGLFAAAVFSLNSFLRQSVLPFAIFFQTVPIIAVAPLLVIYFGFGEPTVIAAAAIVSVFPIVANTLLGLSQIDKNLDELFQIYKARPWDRLWKLKIPSAYWAIYGGIKISAGLAVIGAVAGEFVAGGGLGAMIDSARTQQRIDIVFAAILLLSLLGLGLISIVNLVHFGILKWRPLIESPS